MANYAVLEDTIQAGLNSSEYFAIAAGRNDERFIDLKFNQYTEYPFEYCAEDKPFVDLSYNYVTGIIPDSILQNSDALSKLEFMTFNQRDDCHFTNEPQDW